MTELKKKFQKVNTTMSKPIRKGFRDGIVKREMTAKEHNKNLAPGAIPMKEEKDESFEIISLKEKYLREQLVIAEDSLVKSEFNIKINQEIIKITVEEIKKESEKNAR